MTLTEIIEQQIEWRDNIVSDLRSDWLEDIHRRDFQTQLMLLNQSIASLQTILQTGTEQIFNSSISR